MSELKKQDIESLKEFCGHSHLPILKELAIIAFDELLRLRTDAGDEEVLHLRAVVCNGIWSKDKRDNEEADKAIDRIVSKSVSLRNELSEAREEIEQLRMAVGCATTIKGDMVMRADDPIGMMQEVCSYVAALKSCPEMGEVDAIVDISSRAKFYQMRDHVLTLAGYARRAIASHAAEKQRADDVSKDHSDLIEKVLQSVKLGSSGGVSDMLQALRDCETYAMSANMDQLFRGVVCQFGLVQQGHIPTIEKMLQEGATWEEIGLKIGWCHKTAEKHYIAYLCGKGDGA